SNRLVLFLLAFLEYGRENKSTCKRAKQKISFVALGVVRQNTALVVTNTRWRTSRKCIFRCVADACATARPSILYQLLAACL
ncbi:hypothetical protein BOTBODRAFT_66696, partial [Botryobasidium botryosum FD-172 SS1]